MAVLILVLTIIAIVYVRTDGPLPKMLTRKSAPVLDRYDPHTTKMLEIEVWGEYFTNCKCTKCVTEQTEFENQMRAIEARDNAKREQKRYYQELKKFAGNGRLQCNVCKGLLDYSGWCSKGCVRVEYQEKTCTSCDIRVWTHHERHSELCDECDHELTRFRTNSTGPSI